MGEGGSGAGDSVWLGAQSVWLEDRGSRLEDGTVITGEGYIPIPALPLPPCDPGYDPQG